jgi:hypothetical protein
MCDEPTEPTPPPEPEPCRCHDEVVVVVGRGARLRTTTRGQLAAESRARTDRIIQKIANGWMPGAYGGPMG